MIKYIIYVRKSTDEHSEHQKQSIPDQIIKCIQYAENNWFLIADKPRDFLDFETESDIKLERNEKDEINREIYRKYSNLFIVRERESAKEPYKRPKWRKIIEWVKKWKIKWIISYSPDRQARNLLEAWELIDLVDKWLVELKYTNFYFEPNAAWKMMLWIWFVFSKQYSDKLSEDVTRWTFSKLEKWYALWTYKWWYKINEEWYHEPDWKNFILLKKAFYLKIYEWKTNRYIVNWLNKEWFYREGKNWKRFYITERSIQDIFKDTFYYWEFKYANKIIKLNEVNNYYKSIISKEEFYILQNLIVKKKSSNTKESIYKNIKPFPDWFVLTEDWYSCSFYIAKSRYWKNKLIVLQKTNPNVDFKDLNIPINYFLYSVSKKSKIYSKKKQVRLSEILDTFKEELLNINFDKYTREILLDEWEKYINGTVNSIIKKQKLVKYELEKNNKKLKQIIVDTNFSELSFIEQQILEREKNNLIKKIISLKSQSNNKLQRDYLLDYKKLMNIWFFLIDNKEKLYKVRDSKFLKLFVPNFIVTWNGSKLLIFDEIYKLSRCLVDLTGIEPVYRHKAV
jgi:DNA invertase Pin-like site-specific DNA recombinase